MVEPSENLQKIFDKALDVTKELNHEYQTLYQDSIKQIPIL